MFNRTAFRIVMLLVLLFSAAADAAQRTFVSAGSGSDSNPCTRALPCRNFAPAISQTDVGGEVVVLDSGGYGVVAISKSVALVAPPGVHAAITAFSGDAIDVLAGATDVVIVRGLYLSGLGGEFGIDFQGGKTLHVENCVISGFGSAGVLGQAEDADVYVLDTVSRQNSYGFYFIADTTIRASLDSVRAEENVTYGVMAQSNTLVTVTRSVAAGSGNAGFISASSGVINLESCTTTMNAFGVSSFGTARVRNSMITGNSTGVANGDGASTISFGNNGLHGNDTDGSFSTTVAQQ
jgi:hypothetical protein